jgi:hypothetical protein
MLCSPTLQASFNASWLEAQDSPDLPRIQLSDITAEEFSKQYDQPGRICILTDQVRAGNPVVPHSRMQVSQWPAENWTRANLLAKYGDTRFDVAYESVTNLLEMTLRAYLQYCSTQRDHAPLYLFDRHFVNKVH